MTTRTRRILAMALLLTIALTLCACGGKSDKPSDNGAEAAENAAIPENTEGDSQPAASADEATIPYGDTAVPASMYAYPLFGCVELGTSFQDALTAMGNPSHEETTDNGTCRKLEYIHLEQRPQDEVYQVWDLGFMDDSLVMAACRCEDEYHRGAHFDLEALASMVDSAYGENTRTEAPQLQTILDTLYSLDDDEYPNGAIYFPETEYIAWAPSETMEVLVGMTEDPWGDVYKIMYYNPAMLNLLENHESDGLTYRLNAKDEAIVTGATEETTVLTIPETLDGHPVVSIGNGAFYQARIEQVTLPASLRSIGTYAFAETTLTELALPEGLVRVGCAAFESCSSLASLTLPSTLKRIGSLAFGFCGAIESLELPDGLEYLESYCFSDTHVTRLTMPTSLRAIGSFAFQFSELTEIELPEGLREIGEQAFTRSDLERLDLPASIESIGEGLVYDCSQFQTLTLAEDNEHFKLENGALFTADGKTLLWVEPIAEDAEYAIPEGVEEIAGHVFQNSEAGTFVFPATLKRVGKSAFSGCNNLRSVTLPEGLETLGQTAFANCKVLVSVTLPASLTHIEGDHVFDGCASGSQYSLKITAPAGSAAETYARYHDILFLEAE